MPFCCNSSCCRIELVHEGPAAAPKESGHWAANKRSCAIINCTSCLVRPVFNGLHLVRTLLSQVPDGTLLKGGFMKKVFSLFEDLFVVVAFAEAGEHQFLLIPSKPARFSRRSRWVTAD